MIHGTMNFSSPIEFPSHSCPELFRALDGVRYIAECTKREEDSNKVRASELFLFVQRPRENEKFFV